MYDGMDLPSEFLAAGPIDPGQLSVDGLEVTQVVQDMTHSVTLVAEKSTVVRVYLDRAVGGIIQVRGDLEVQREAGGSIQVVASQNAVIIDPVQNNRLGAKRQDIALSLNFLLPRDLTGSGRLKLRNLVVRDAVSGQAVPISGSQATRTVEFIPSPPLRIRLLAMEYSTEGNASTTYVPTAHDYALIESWLRRAYPVAQLELSRAVVPASGTFPFTCNDINAQLTGIRNQDISNGTDARTHYYGLVADGGGTNFMRGCASGIPAVPDPGTVASGPTGAASFNWDTDGSYGDWYTGHELGHTFGRFHPGFCSGNSANDPAFPYVNGQIGDANHDFVGLDVGDPAHGIPMAALPGDQWHDVMTYCARQWLSFYTYEGIRQRLITEEALGAGSTGTPVSTIDSLDSNASRTQMKKRTGQFINIVATVNLSQSTGSIRFVHPVESFVEPAETSREPVQLVTRDGSGTEISRYPVVLKRDTCLDSDQQETAVVDGFVAYSDELMSIDLLIDGEVADSYMRSGAVPSVDNIRTGAPQPGTAFAFIWDVPPIPSNIRYTVQASTDNGTTWQTLAIGHPDPNINIHRESFAGAADVQLRVIATDGFTSTVQTSNALFLDAQ